MKYNTMNTTISNNSSTTEQPSDDYIQKLILAHKKKVERERIEYDSKKDDPVFKEANRLRAAFHYKNNKEQKKEHYLKNKQTINYRNLYNYYKRRERIDDFKDKHGEKFDYLVAHGFITA